MAELHIIFDGPPSHESGRFVEVENADGKSISVGKWEQRGDYWHLILPDTIKSQKARLAELEAEVARLRVGHDRYEIVRRMSSRRFEAMFNESISTDKRFDDLVDAAKESA